MVIFKSTYNRITMKAWGAELKSGRIHRLHGTFALGPLCWWSETSREWFTKDWDFVDLENEEWSNIRERVMALRSIAGEL